MCWVNFNISGVFSNPNMDTSGIIELLGYSINSDDAPGSGGNWPWNTEYYGSTVNVVGVIPGFYHFKYRSQLSPKDDCYGESIFKIAIVQGTEQMYFGALEIKCKSDPAFTLRSVTSIQETSESLPYTVVVSGDTDNPGYIDALDFDNIMFDPSLSPVGYYSYTITITPNLGVPGFIQICNEYPCQSATILVDIEVKEAFSGGDPTNETPCN